VVNIWQGLLTDAVTQEHLYSVARRDNGRVWRVLINAGGVDGASAMSSFPEPVFEEAVLRCLKEIDPALLTQSDGPDRLSVLTGRLEKVRQQLAEMQDALVGCTKPPKTVMAAAADLEAEEERLEEERRQAAREAAHPLSETWGRAKSLLDVIATAEDRVRLRSLLRRVVEGIWVLIVPRGWDRVAGVQIRFKGSDQERSYIITYRRGVMPSGRRASRRRGEQGEDVWAVRSRRWTPALDLRRPEHVVAMRDELAGLDLAAFAATGRRPRCSPGRP
jgi:hypothetical protein